MADAIAELRREIHRRGYDTRKDNAGHYEVFDAEGKMVRTKRGKPVKIASTPVEGRSRSLANTVSMLRSAGVLPPPTKVKPRQESKVKLGRDRLAQYSKVLRDELVRLMELYELNQAQVYRYADYYAGQHGMPVPSNPQGVISKFLKGTNLMNKNYQWLSAAVSAIKANEGIPDMTTADETPEPQETGVEVEGTSTTPKRIPSLAFDAMRLMYADSPDDAEIREVVEKIARLELT